jgi:hypothetical protein
VFWASPLRTHAELADWLLSQPICDLPSFGMYLVSRQRPTYLVSSPACLDRHLPSGHWQAQFIVARQD